MLQDYVFYLSFLQYFGDGMPSDRCCSKYSQLVIGEHNDISAPHDWQ